MSSRFSHVSAGVSSRVPAEVAAKVWSASEVLHAPAQPVWPSGHAALDACLPGGGWPLGALVEVLQATGQHQEWQLVLPALRRWQRHAGPAGQPARSGVLLVAPPCQPQVSALAARGLLAERLVHVNSPDAGQAAWACEQALQCPAIGAVLVWLPGTGSATADMTALRRLQLAACRHAGLLWVFRPLAVQGQATPAVVRLAVAPAATPAVPGSLRVDVLKRRGPRLDRPLLLPPADAGIQAVLAGARWRQALRRQHSQRLHETAQNGTAPKETHVAPTVVDRAAMLAA